MAQEHFKTATLDMTWDPATRICVARVTPDSSLGGADAEDLVGAIERWIGESPTRFAVLADGGGGHETDRDYRAVLSRYFRERIDVAFVAFFRLNAVLTVVVDMLRVANARFDGSIVSMATPPRRTVKRAVISR